MKIGIQKLVTAFLLLAVAAHAAPASFGFDQVRDKAKDLASKPYAPRPTRVPEWLQKINYDEYRLIRFNREHAWWKDETHGFQLQFFHPGFIYKQTVQISEIEKGAAKPIPFSRELFEYGGNLKVGPIPDNMGFTGFRIHTPLNNPNVMDELAVFQGASYFRAIGKGMRYGLSARGLALNTGEAPGEEFPVFEEFWVKDPTPGTKEMVLYALMDSPSVTGAYAFTIRPGVETTMRVKATVFRRQGAPDQTFGIAPLTSMFWHGENTFEREGDLRPEVHDSDGLLMERGNGEIIWRPLRNPKTIQISAFMDENPKGFGLVQRDRQFDSYEDLEAAYHLRPSTWVEPIGAWGKGTVHLVELPTPDETNDNIVAFWVPEKTPPAGEPIEFEYLLHWYMEGLGGKKIPGGYVVATRQGYSKTHEPDLQRFWVDFDSTSLRSRNLEGKVEAVVSVGEGATLVHQSVVKNPFNGTWRVAFSIRPSAEKRAVELRCFLKKDPHILSETWSYLWNP